MEHIQEIEMDLTLTIVLVSSTRRVLADAKRDFVEHLLETVRQQRRSDRIKVRHRREFQSAHALRGKVGFL